MGALACQSAALVVDVHFFAFDLTLMVGSTSRGLEGRMLVVIQYNQFCSSIVKSPARPGSVTAGFPSLNTDFWKTSSHQELAYGNKRVGATDDATILHTGCGN